LQQVDKKRNKQATWEKR